MALREEQHPQTVKKSLNVVFSRGKRWNKLGRIVVGRGGGRERGREREREREEGGKREVREREEGRGKGR